jgi:hypothetical protein
MINQTIDIALLDVEYDAEDQEFTPDLTIEIPMEALSGVANSIVKTLLQSNPENSEQAQMGRMMKTTIRGLLLMQGDKILTALMGKDHAKPGKKDDILEWYITAFVQALIFMASKKRYIVSTTEKVHSDYVHIKTVIKVHALTIPIIEP